jgi:DNA-binding transcriptional LysR family regulator
VSTPTLKQLEAFYSAATCANFATAAERLHLSVSSLSKRIAELEQALGRQLFDRTGHKAVLTYDGNRLLPSALAIIDAVTALQGTLATERGLSGRCSFGVGELSALTWLPRFVARVRRDHPGLIVEPYVDVGAVLERRVEKGELDFAVIAGRSSRSGVLSQPIGVAHFAWMAAPSVAGGAKEMTPEFFSRFPLITLPGGAGTTRILDDWLMGQGVTVEHRIECNNWVAIAGMLREGLGVGFLQEGWAHGGPPDKPLQVLLSTPPLAPLHYAFQWRRDDIRSLITVMRDLIGAYVNFDEQMAVGPQ